MMIYRFISAKERKERGARCVLHHDQCWEDWPVVQNASLPFNATGTDKSICKNQTAQTGMCSPR